MAAGTKGWDGNGVKLTPTCVGNTANAEEKKLPIKNHPRMRGEYTVTIT
ncbi:hypothetical protein LZY01_19000 [Levilactobacillus zymae]|uniref:Uncharacterized protein n=1 Tax=Levilactobacillus zymae TaxID=267363 RepID=A0ABQ0X323_9LACO|nr:hypothetical protein LZY01_19000 [Levilactobacillus zymae]